MPAPDFSTKVKETLAKRAAFICSNPDCRVTTVGPNSDESKATTIGEAAHIFGARPNSKRFSKEMTDAARAEITNAIWLCRNCHKLIDSDGGRFSEHLLFAWREEHERYVQLNLGSASSKLEYSLDEQRLHAFQDLPPLIRRIVIDKPEGWEWRLMAELMRHLNAPIFRRLDDLRDDLYSRPIESLSEDYSIDWVKKSLANAERLIGPLSSSISRINTALGSPGEEASVDNMLHAAKLVQDNLEQVANFEESIRFTKLPDNYEGIHRLLTNVLGEQASKIAEIPKYLDEMVALLETDHGGTEENPIVVKKEIVFEMPKNWARDMDKELKKLSGQSSSNGMWWIILLSFIIGFLML